MVILEPLLNVMCNLYPIIIKLDLTQFNGCKEICYFKERVKEKNFCIRNEEKQVR